MQSFMKKNEKGFVHKNKFLVNKFGSTFPKG